MQQAASDYSSFEQNSLKSMNDTDIKRDSKTIGPLYQPLTTPVLLKVTKNQLKARSRDGQTTGLIPTSAKHQNLTNSVARSMTTTVNMEYLRT
ncbi:hypothetical protein QL285_049920 [Trifolium repens]|nr:hypothetical protein QL285_049920 [Trifolium repens]